MMKTEEQAFLNTLDKKLWTAADRLRSSLDAAVYKHAVLGLIFLKYVSDSFRMRQAEIEAALKAEVERLKEEVERWKDCAEARRRALL